MKPSTIQKGSFELSIRLRLENWKTQKILIFQTKARVATKGKCGKFVFLRNATCKIVRENSRCNDASVAVEDRLQVGLRDVLRQARHIQICTFD